jgi:uncharacterized protein YoxC
MIILLYVVIIFLATMLVILSIRLQHFNKTCRKELGIIRKTLKQEK